MRIIIVFLFVALASLQYKLWLGDCNLFGLMHLNKKITLQEHKNILQTNHNQDVVNEIIELKHNERAFEEEARFELGLIKDGEHFYKFLD